MNKMSVTKLEELIEKFKGEDDSLASLIAVLASCRAIEEKVGTDLPEKSLIREASAVQGKIVNAIMAATLLKASQSGDNSNYEDWLKNG